MLIIKSFGWIDHVIPHGLIWKYVEFHTFQIPYMDPYILLRNHVDLYS